MIPVEQGLVERDGAASGLQELHQRRGLRQRQRDVLGQLLLARIVRQVLRFHAAQIEQQAVAGRQPLVLAVPVGELNELVVGRPSSY